MMYVLAKDNTIVALDAASGKLLWVHENGRGPITTRGINYWESKDRSDRRLLYSFENRLQAIDARTGKSIPVVRHQRLGRFARRARTRTRDISVQSGTPAACSRTWSSSDPRPTRNTTRRPATSGRYDVRSGQLAWTFHNHSARGGIRYDTWPKDAWKDRGRRQRVAEMSIDEKHGVLYVPTASPKYNFYGANRKGANLFGDSLVALDARTASGSALPDGPSRHLGYDNATAPKLLTVRHDGKMVDIVAQAGKTGFLYVFDRATGQPLWPIEERPVPRSEMPGEENLANAAVPDRAKTIRAPDVHREGSEPVHRRSGGARVAAPGHSRRAQ
jgi:quinoprotein glucose dehydrogenase